MIRRNKGSHTFGKASNGMIGTISGKNLGKRHYHTSLIYTDRNPEQAAGRRLQQWQKAADKKGITLEEYMATFVGNVSSSSEPTNS